MVVSYSEMSLTCCRFGVKRAKHEKTGHNRIVTYGSVAKVVLRTFGL